MATYSPIRWTVSRAATEFGLNPKTVTKRVAAAGLTAGQDGKFSTQDMAKGLFGDLNGAKLRLMNASAECR